jgi:AcrR family transcriptional regulator
VGQAEALAAAMIDVAASNGYANASVARVLARAGTSRQSFYRHYSCREECFIAAYRSAAGEVGARLREAVRLSSPGERPEASLAALLRAVDERPAAARVLLVEALGASAAVRAEHERQIEGVEIAIERFLDAPGAPPLQVSGTALLGGICAVLAEHLIGGGGRAVELFPDLLAWVGSYRLCDGPRREGSAFGGPVRRFDEGPGGRAEGPTSDETPLLPRGRSALPPEAVRNARRDRILAATLRQTAGRGYARLTVADIVRQARVPRAAFYAHFSNKQEAFLAVQRHVLRESIATAAAEFSIGRTWPEKVWRGLAALLAYLASHPDAAYLGLVEAHSAGEAALARDQENRAAYTLFLGDGYHQRPQAARLPRLCSQAVAGAISAIMRRYVVRGEAALMREALPQCAYVALAPFIGPEAAVCWVEERLRAAA